MPSDQMLFESSNPTITYTTTKIAYQIITRVWFELRAVFPSQRDKHSSRSTMLEIKAKKKFMAEKNCQEKIYDKKSYGKKITSK